MSQQAFVSMFEYWTERVKRDLTPFIDPGTTLTIEEDKRSVRARWMMRQEERSVTFSISLDKGVSVEEQGVRMSYEAFFASSKMADLLSLSKMMLQSRPATFFIKTQAIRTDQEHKEPHEAVDLLRRSLQDPWGEDATLMVLVTGEAGSGKTYALQELVRSQAARYASGEVTALFLYINAQGRALARFSEALATELQDLRATLTYHSVSTLVRLGLIVPVIDGFDELLGVSGYDDAFNSLASFVEELDGSGRILASARSTYYEQEFVARSNRVSGLGSQVWKQIPIRVLDWGGAEFEAYVAHRVGDSNLDSEARARVVDSVRVAFSGRNVALRSKPLFAAKALDLLLSGTDLSLHGDLIKAMVFSYVERERTEKLLDKAQAPLLAHDRLVELLVSLAEEMWNQETRQLDRISVREVAEYVLLTSDGVDENAQGIVTKRMAQMAFLSPGDRPESVVFEHEVFFSYFLSQRFDERLRHDEAISDLFLGRSVLPLDVAEIVARQLVEEEPAPDTQRVLEMLGGAAAIQSLRTPQVRENAGVLVMALLRRTSELRQLQDLQIANVVFPGGSLDGVVLSNCSFVGTEWRRVDLAKVKILNCHSADSMLVEVLVDPTFTRLELVGLDVSRDVVGLRWLTASGEDTSFDPRRTANVLQQIGTIPVALDQSSLSSGVSAEVLNLIEKLGRAYRRSNPVCVADDTLRQLFLDPRWPEIQDLLVDSGVVTVESRNAKGQPKQFLRRQVRLEDLLAGASKSVAVPGSVSAFWDSLERTFPAV